MSAGAFPCNEYLSAESLSKIYLACVIMVESVIYGSCTAWVYIRNPVVKLRKEVMMNIETKFNGNC